jgi:hypothetical protein
MKTENLTSFVQYGVDIEDWKKNIGKISHEETQMYSGNKYTKIQFQYKKSKPNNWYLAVFSNDKYLGDSFITKKGPGKLYMCECAFKKLSFEDRGFFIKCLPYLSIGKKNPKSKFMMKGHICKT